MIRYTKGPAPKRLTELAATPGVSWDSLGAADRVPLRKALRNDQGDLCAYCQRRLPPEDTVTAGFAMKIEHWHARSNSPDQALKWSNMIGVCSGRGPALADARPETHCDESRGNVPLFLHPVEGQGPDPTAFLKYTKNGSVLPTESRVDADVAVLKLNAVHLQRGRRAILVALWQRLDRSGFSTQELRRLAGAHRIRPGERAPEHSAFVRYHLLKRLRQRGENE